jgi:poly-gamma-glutamate system protein
MKRERGVFLLALISVAAFGLYKILPFGAGLAKDRDMVAAAETMNRAITALRACALDRKVSIDVREDLNRTGLIGPEQSPITTSLGHLDAKRTTTNPNFAGLVVALLKEAGVRRGDAVAVGASSSFPALVIASLCAVAALEAKPVMIASLGASNWGATNPDFTLLEMLDCLRQARILDVRPVALAVGGEIDNGSDMTEEGRLLLAEKIRRTGILFLQEPDLAANVGARLRLYEENAAPSPLKAYINVGGSWANMGTDSSILNLKPGLTEVVTIPPPGKRGVIQEMASRKIPVIHLLFVRGLAERYGLPWDPVPLPAPGEGSLFLNSVTDNSITK